MDITVFRVVSPLLRTEQQMGWNLLCTQIFFKVDCALKFKVHIDIRRLLLEIHLNSSFL